jgi:hypothetical protein
VSGTVIGVADVRLASGTDTGVADGGSESTAEARSVSLELKVSTVWRRVGTVGATSGVSADSGNMSIL